jgi:3-isopropylmalate dehydratase small subunit
VKPARGRAWLFGDDVNTDVVHPPQFFSLDPETVKRGLFHGLDPQLQPRLRAGDILIAGRNFGCGSSRETSIQSLKLNEVGAIIAVDFARIFFRSATNNALPCLTFARPADRTKLTPEQHVEVSFEDSMLHTDDGETIVLEPAGAFVRKVWEAGGLLAAMDTIAHEVSVP